MKTEKTPTNNDLNKLDEVNSHGLIDKAFDALPHQREALSSILSLPANTVFFD